MTGFHRHHASHWFSEEHVKSTLVRQFAAANGLNLVEINLEKHAGLDSIFQTLNIEKILLSIDATTHKSSDGPKTLLFLDEIQANHTPWQRFAIFLRNDQTFSSSLLDLYWNSSLLTTRFQCPWDA